MATGYQKKKIAKVLREHKEGKLRSGSDAKVKSRKQAIAITLSEAGMSRKKNNPHKRY